MPSSILVTSPDYDVMTRYLAAWAQKLTDDLQRRGHQVYTLKEKSVTKIKFHKMLKKVNPEVVFINGHGDANRIAGHDDEIILDISEVTMLDGYKVYALSCKTAQGLGPAARAAGSTDYVGYAEDFMIAYQESKTMHPTEDTVAELFFEPSNKIVSELLKGNSGEIAAEKGRQAFANSIQRALNSNIQSDDDKFVSYLLWDLQNLTSCA